MAHETPKKNVTIFGPETEFDGTLSFTDDLIITGQFKGTITASGNLTIEKNAVCTVDSIAVQSVVIAGTVRGTITAHDRIEMCSGSTVTGDVSSARLRIANNVEFNGHVTMIDRMPETDLFLTASPEFKRALVLYSDTIE
ncbi:MAG: polymer-forming cytoskeletal protein [Treponema sp.]|nr:polymer-forming cytoskeletal protein [Treponema sp.]